MKTLMAAATLALAAGNARADLGDTYAESCRRFGAEGAVNKEAHSMIWKVNALGDKGSYWIISEWFVKNQCVALICTGSDPKGVYESALWQILNRNALPTQIWTEYSHGDNGQRDFVTTDQKLFGMACTTDAGCPFIRVAYASWMKVHKLFNAPPSDSEPGNASGSGRAPIEDSI